MYTVPLYEDLVAGVMKCVAMETYNTLYRFAHAQKDWCRRVRAGACVRVNFFMFRNLNIKGEQLICLFC